VLYVPLQRSGQLLAAGGVRLQIYVTDSKSTPHTHTHTHLFTYFLKVYFFFESPAHY